MSGVPGWPSFDEVQRMIADYARTHPLPGPKAMVSIPIDPRKAAEQERGPRTFGEAARLLRAVALTGSATERRNAQKALDALEGRTTTKEAKMTKQSRAYSSPFGEIPSKKDDKSASEDKGTSVRDLMKVLRKSANDSNDPKREQAKKLLQLLTDFFVGDDDDAEASEDETEDETRPKGVPAAARGRAKALSGQDVTRLSPYAAMLDEQMGLAVQPRTRVEGTQLILSSAEREVKP